MYIVDEAHSSLATSRVLLRILRDWAVDGKRYGVTLLELTATGYSIDTGEYIMERGTNYNVVDIPVMRAEVPKLIKELTDEKRDLRMMVFCSSV